jgi:DNA-binding NtrC family response regulator
MSFQMSSPGENLGFLENPEAFEGIVSQNSQMLSIFERVESVAKTCEPVLITGETGVGKELISKAIHKASGLKGRFVAVNVAGLDDNVFSDSLFGHKKGAFTGAAQARPGLIEQAAGGTLLLDEIGDLSQASQVKLLRLLQEGDYLPLGQDEPKKSLARVLAVTSADLWGLARTNHFRKDLNFRLRTHHINIPPLRDRKDDIPLLLEFFVNEAASALKKSKSHPQDELIELLKAYPFPGNIRELKSLVFDAVSMQKSETLPIEMFKYYITQRQWEGIVPMSAGTEGDGMLTFPGKLPTIKEATQLLIDEAMRRANGNQTIAAGMLGISQPALSKRLRNMRFTSKTRSQ